MHDGHSIYFADEAVEKFYIMTRRSIKIDLVLVYRILSRINLPTQLRRLRNQELILTITLGGGSRACGTAISTVPLCDLTLRRFGFVEEDPNYFGDQPVLLLNKGAESVV